MESLFGIPMDNLAVYLLIAVGVILALLFFVGWRNRVMVRLGLRNIPRRRAQTLLIVFGLMLSTLIVSAAFGTGDTMTNSFRALALDDMGQVDEVIDTSDEGMLFVSFDDSDEGDDRSRPSSETEYFSQTQFETLAEQVAKEQAAGDADALLIEALTPVIQEEVGPVINYTARQSEPSITVAGYDPATADDFDKLFSLDGKRVRVAELGPGEVYLNQSMSSELAAEPGHELAIYLGDEPIRVTVKAVVKHGGLSGQLILPLDQAQAAVAKRGQINAILVSNVGDPYDGAQHSNAVARVLERLLNGTNLNVSRAKEMYLMGAEFVGSIFTTMFIGFGSFSIAAALLLIFLIFVMLAAERKQEMGMARAVGTRRRHLIQMFVFEGTAYDLAAAAVGALLGSAVGLATVGVLARSFENIEGIGAFQLKHHLEPRSIIVAYCLGVLLTFATVAISSWRVSRLNIVSAIRDLPPPPSPDAGLRALFTQPWRHLADALRFLLTLRLHRALKRLLWSGPISTLSFFWALIGRGPLTIVLGYLSLRASLSVGSLFLFNLGVSLILIGIGLTIRWMMRIRMRHVRPEARDRIAFSFAGISLLVFWSLPFDALDFLDLPNLSSGPEMFVLSGVMMVAGAVWTIIYNSDLLLRLVTWLLSPFGRLLPVVRTAIAYPMHSKFRTGLTIAMFALVLFMLVFMSVFVNILNEAMDEEGFGEISEYDIEVNVSAKNPIPNLKTAIAVAPELNAADYVTVDGKSSEFIWTEGGQSYFITLAAGIDAKEAARALESAFLDYGMESVVIETQIQAARSMINSIFGLLQAFMGLGLVVGSASIGIISTRSVVERRQQIGVLRAIGYRPWMIQWSFLLEASFVALLGILLGVGLGLILAYNFYNGEIASTPGGVLPFSIPWMTLGIIVVIAYVMSMLTTYLPSWQAARVYPAEALRYE